MGISLYSTAQPFSGTLRAALRLLFPNACEGAVTSAEDALAGLAHSLVLQRIPAVVAMQFAVSKRAAITLTQEFYRALADCYPVDAALASTRAVAP